MKVRGARIFLRESGSGPPVLFLHGNPDSSDLWLGVVSLMGAGFHSLAPDLPGFGRSSLPRGFDFRLPTLSRFVDELLAAAGVHGPIYLVVHDFGGPYGLSWAIEHEERVAGILVLSSLFSASLRWHAWARIWRTPILGELSMALMNRWLFRRELRRGSPSLEDAYLDTVYSFSSRATRRMILALYRATDPEGFRGWEERFQALAQTVPVKVLWGRRDPYLPTSLAETFGSPDIEIWEDCGHWLPVEAPRRVAEAFLALAGMDPGRLGPEGQDADGARVIR